MSENASEFSEMSELGFVQEMLHTRIAPPSISSDIGARVRHASRALGWSFSRTKDCWYGDDRVAIRPAELRKIAEKTGEFYDLQNVQRGRAESAEIAEIMSQAEALLESGDADFYRAFTDGLRAFIGAFHSARASRADHTDRAA